MHRGVEEALRGDVAALTLSGSSPSPVTHGLYSDLIALARARRIPVFLDTYGPALDAIWGFWPTAIQLNRREAAAHLRQAGLSDDDAAGLLHEWHRHGVVWGVITDGPRPAAIMYRGRRYRATPPPIEAVNPIGSGDSLLAGLVDGWLEPDGARGAIAPCAGLRRWPMRWSGTPAPSTRPRSTDGPSEIEIEPMARGDLSTAAGNPSFFARRLLFFTTSFSGLRGTAADCSSAGRVLLVSSSAVFFPCFSAFRS